MIDFTRRLIAVFGSALVLMFFSEFYFVNEGPVLTLLQTSVWNVPFFLAAMAAFYSLFAYIFLIAIDWFSIKTTAGLMLAGTLFGWATEGLIVPVVHEAPPITWIFPSIGWHALIDVLFGWFLLRIAMRRLPWPALSVVFVATGLVWAIWATWYWNEADPGALAPMSQSEFTKLATYSCVGWIIGNILADFGSSRGFRASKWEIGAVLLITALFFAMMALPYLPMSLGLIAPIAVTVWALWRGGNSSKPQVDRLELLAARTPISAYFASVLMPLAAIIGYWVVLKTGFALPGDLIAPLLMLAGLIGFIWAVWRTAVTQHPRAAAK